MCLSKTCFSLCILLLLSSCLCKFTSKVESFDFNKKVNIPIGFYMITVGGHGEKVYHYPDSSMLYLDYTYTGPNYSNVLHLVEHGNIGLLIADTFTVAGIDNGLAWKHVRRKQSSFGYVGVPATKVGYFEKFVSELLRLSERQSLE